MSPVYTLPLLLHLPDFSLQTPTSLLLRPFSICAASRCPHSRARASVISRPNRSALSPSRPQMLLTRSTRVRSRRKRPAQRRGTPASSPSRAAAWTFSSPPRRTNPRRSPHRPARHPPRPRPDADTTRQHVQYSDPHRLPIALKSGGGEGGRRRRARTFSSLARIPCTDSPHRANACTSHTAHPAAPHQRTPRGRAAVAASPRISRASKRPHSCVAPAVSSPSSEPSTHATAPRPGAFAPGLLLYSRLSFTPRSPR